MTAPGDGTRDRELVEQVRHHLKGLSTEGRLNFIAEVQRGYCKHCMDALPQEKPAGVAKWHFKPCYCTNEE